MGYQRLRAPDQPQMVINGVPDKANNVLINN